LALMHMKRRSLARNHFLLEIHLKGPSFGLYFGILSSRLRLRSQRDKILHSSTSTGHRPHRELATHKQRAALPRPRADRQMEMSAPAVRRPSLLNGWCGCDSGIYTNGESNVRMTRKRESHRGIPEL
jgi:hypothetical protein